jgi:hypothetical protein
VYNLEACINLMGPGVECVLVSFILVPIRELTMSDRSLALLIDYADKGKNPSMGQARKFLHIIQSHYPERLGRALILNVPFLLKAFYSLVTPFVDPVTRTKMRFNPQPVVDGLFAPDQITKEWPGGEVDFVYEHEKYWTALTKLSAERKAAFMNAWRKLGGSVGIKEWDYKCLAEKALCSAVATP